eukprot:5539467-Amphidinium_carterae.1
MKTLDQFDFACKDKPCARRNPLTKTRLFSSGVFAKKTASVESDGKRTPHEGPKPMGKIQFRDGLLD